MPFSSGRLSASPIFMLTPQWNGPAGNPARGVPARPGLNAIRHDTIYSLPEAELDKLMRIADSIMINAASKGLNPAILILAI